MDVNVLWWDGVELDSLLRDGDRLKGSCELCNVPSGSMKDGKFLEISQRLFSYNALCCLELI